MSKSKLDAAIKRNIAELQHVIHIRITLLGIEKHDDQYGTGENFVRIIYKSLFDDYIARCIKILDCHRDALSIFYIQRCCEEFFSKKQDMVNFDLDMVMEIAKKLKIIRDKTHFHIDKKAVFDPKDVWRAANLSGAELSKAIDGAWSLLGLLAEEKGLEKVELLGGYSEDYVYDIISKIDVR